MKNSNSSPVHNVVLARVPGVNTIANFSEPTTIEKIVASVGENPAGWKYMIAGQEVPATTEVNEFTGTIRLIKTEVKGN